MRIGIIAMATGATALVLSGCMPSASPSDQGSGTPSPATVSVEGNWSLSSLPPGAPARLEDAAISFDVNNFTATVGCNELFGGYLASDGTIEFVNVGTTEVACEHDGFAEAEEVLLAALTTASIVDSSVELQTSVGQLVFEKE